MRPGTGPAKLLRKDITAQGSIFSSFAECANNGAMPLNLFRHAFLREGPATESVMGIAKKYERQPDANQSITGGRQQARFSE